MDLEIRQVGGATVLQGRFPYGRLATISNRGRRRKESIMPRAFRFAIEQEPERKIDILVGHDFGKPIASRQSGTLTIRDSAAAVEFEATLPADPPAGLSMQRRRFGVASWWGYPLDSWSRRYRWSTTPNGTSLSRATRG